MIVTLSHDGWNFRFALDRIYVYRVCDSVCCSMCKKRGAYQKKICLYVIKSSEFVYEHEWGMMVRDGIMSCQFIVRNTIYL